MKIEEFILLIIGVLIGTLFGLGFSDWGKVDPGSITNWLIALGTLALVFIAIYSALSWKAQRIPEARKDFIHAIVNLENYFYQNYRNSSLTEEQFKEFTQKLTDYIWDIEKSIVYYYQFNKSHKVDIDAQYHKIVKLIIELDKNLSKDRNEYNLSKRKNEIIEILNECEILSNLVITKNLMINYDIEATK